MNRPNRRSLYPDAPAPDEQPADQDHVTGGRSRQAAPTPATGGLTQSNSAADSAEAANGNTTQQFRKAQLATVLRALIR